MNGSKQVLEQLGLEMFFSEINLLLVLYKNGMKKEVERKKYVLDLAKDYFMKAIKGFQNYKENQKTNKLTLTKEAIEADTAFHVLLVAANKNPEELPKILQSSIEVFRKITEGKDIPPEDIDRTVRILKLVLNELRKSYYDYLEAPIIAIWKLR
jgi:hypothetical protein